MSEAKHTPGPWMQIPSVQSDQRCICTQNGYRVDIARTYGMDLDVIGANARLISAAPELLEALRGAVALADENKAEAEYEGRWVIRPPRMQAMYDKCVAAIAKATAA